MSPLNEIPFFFPIGAEGSVSGVAGRRNLTAGPTSAEGVWGWSSLGELEAFCRDRFVELILGWTVVPGDESRRVKPVRLEW